MNVERRTCWRLVLAVVMAASLVLVAMACGSSDSSLEVGSPAPDFKAQTLDGREARLSDFKGKTVVLNLWATWCKYCLLEMPTLQSAHQQYGEQGLVIVAMNAREDPVTVSKYVQAAGYTFPVLLDTDGSVSQAYRARALPTTYFIDGDGIIRAKRVGAMDEDTLLSGIKAASNGTID